MTGKIITVIGGSGFIGRYVVGHLAASGYRIRVAVRNPDAALRLKTAGDPGQIALVSGDLAHPDTLKTALQGAYAVVNLVGILFESGSQKFEALHARGPGTLARMAKEAGVERFIQISALGVDNAFGSHYARTKLTGEKAVQSAFPQATILRPGVVFGPEDHFFNQFAGMPFLPLIGGGRTRLQPVYVDDVAKAITTCLAQERTKGETYELAGNTAYTMKALYEFVNKTLRTHKPMLRLSFGLASLVALKCEIAFKLIPFIRRPLLTRDQVKLLKYNNVISPGAKTFSELGIVPEPLELVVPRYLARFNPKKVT